MTISQSLLKYSKNWVNDPRDGQVDSSLISKGQHFQTRRAITLTFGSAACEGRSIWSLPSDWRIFSGRPFASKYAESTFGCRPLISKGPDGHSKTWMKILSFFAVTLIDGTPCIGPYVVP